MKHVLITATTLLALSTTAQGLERYKLEEGMTPPKWACGVKGYVTDHERTTDVKGNWQT